MCKCGYSFLTPFCGLGDCQWPAQEAVDLRTASEIEAERLAGKRDSAGRGRTEVYQRVDVATTPFDAQAEIAHLLLRIKILERHTDINDKITEVDKRVGDLIHDVGNLVNAITADRERLDKIELDKEFSAEADLRTLEDTVGVILERLLKNDARFTDLDVRLQDRNRASTHDSQRITALEKRIGKVDKRSDVRTLADRVEMPYTPATARGTAWHNLNDGPAPKDRWILLRAAALVDPPCVAKWRDDGRFGAGWYSDIGAPYAIGLRGTTIEWAELPQ